MTILTCTFIMSYLRVNKTALKTIFVTMITACAVYPNVNHL